MLTEYIRGAMRRAKYEVLEDDGSYYGEIPGFQGVWASAKTLEECRDRLQGALETWIVFGLRQNHPMPAVDGEDLSFEEAADAADGADQPGQVDPVPEEA
jgi:predicted RNase H-like HicB family nuclease